MPDKNLTKNSAKKFSGEVPEGTEFVTRSGAKVTSLLQLYDVILRMNDDDFSHHVNEDKNDFYNWIFHIIKDKRLADLLYPLKSKKEILNVIEKRIYHYNNIVSDKNKVEKTSKSKKSVKLGNKPAVKSIKKSIKKQSSDKKTTKKKIAKKTTTKKTNAIKLTNKKAANKKTTNKKATNKKAANKKTTNKKASSKTIDNKKLSKKKIADDVESIINDLKQKKFEKAIDDSRLLASDVFKDSKDKIAKFIVDFKQYYKEYTAEVDKISFYNKSTNKKIKKSNKKTKNIFDSVLYKLPILSDKAKELNKNSNPSEKVLVETKLGIKELNENIKEPQSKLVPFEDYLELKKERKIIQEKEFDFLHGMFIGIILGLIIAKIIFGL